MVVFCLNEGLLLDFCFSVCNSKGRDKRGGDVNAGYKLSYQKRYGEREKKSKNQAEKVKRE